MLTARSGGNALFFLMTLGRRQETVNWLPSWLSAGPSADASVRAAIQTLIALVLGHFRTDEARATISHFSTAIRRLYKLSFVTRPELWRHGQLLHALERYLEPELSWRQIVSSPAQHIRHELDRLEIAVTAQFVKDCRDDQGRFLTQTARSRLREFWQAELKLLSAFPNYRLLLRERGPSELFPSEEIGVNYDFLGHICLCMIDQFDEWRDYTLKHHRPDVQIIAALGSWQANRWLGSETDNTNSNDIDPTVVAERLFFGDLKMLEGLRDSYGF